VLVPRIKHFFLFEGRAMSGDKPFDEPRVPSYLLVFSDTAEVVESD